MSPSLRHNIVQWEPFTLSCGEGDSYKAVFKFRILWSSLLRYRVLVCNYQVDFYIDSILCFVPGNKDIKTWILPFTRNYLRRLMSLSVGWHKNSIWFRGIVTFWKPHQKCQWVLNHKHWKFRFWSPELCCRIKSSVRCEYGGFIQQD